MAATPVKFVGVGKIFDATNNVCLSNQAEFSLTATVEEIEIPEGDSFGTGYIPTKQSFGGRLACRDVTANLVAALIGGSAAANGLKFISKESGTVPSAPGPYTVALTNAAELYTPSGVTYAPIEVTDSDGVTYEQVAGGSEAAGKFSESSGTLTFHEDDADKVLEISYWYDDADDGVTVQPSVTTVPGANAYIFSGYGYSTRIGSQQGWITIYVKKLQRTGEVAFGASVQDAGTVSFDFRATVSAATDLQICFEQY